MDITTLAYINSQKKLENDITSQLNLFQTKKDKYISHSLNILQKCKEKLFNINVKGLTQSCDNLKAIMDQKIIDKNKVKNLLDSQSNDLCDTYENDITFFTQKNALHKTHI